MADNTTLNRGDDTIGVRRVHESEDGGGHVGVVRVEDDEQQRYETQGTGKKLANPQSGQNRDGENVDYGSQKKTAGKDKSKDDDFGGVNIVDKQPEIGSDEDPGRYAEEKFTQRQAMQAGVPGGGFGKAEDENMYDVLGDKKI